jgi:hypothetical protein
MDVALSFVLHVVVLLRPLLLPLLPLLPPAAAVWHLQWLARYLLLPWCTPPAEKQQDSRKEQVFTAHHLLKLYSYYVCCSLSVVGCLQALALKQ